MDKRNKYMNIKEAKLTVDETVLSDCAFTGRPLSLFPVPTTSSAVFGDTSPLSTGRRH